jgi:ABC-type oligopeptide transport system substrate-binding subunit
LRFADGRTVTAADFAAALRRSLGPAGAAGSAPAYLSLIANRPDAIQAVSARKLRIRLTHPAAHFLAELAFPAGFVVQPGIMSRYGLNWTDHAAGFGPFVVRSWRHMRSLTLVPNRHYYGGAPRVGRITVTFYPSTGQAVRAYRNGTLDVVSGLPAGTTFASSPPGLRRVSSLALDYLAFNTSRFPFHHVNARAAFAAVAQGADPPAGATFRAAGLVPPAFGVADTPWSPSATPQQYLRLAHYDHKHPLPRVTFIAPRDSRVTTLAAALRDAWESKLHAQVTLRLLNTSNYETVLDAHAFDLALVEWGGDYPDPQDFLGTQLGASRFNVTGWSTKRYNRVIAKADALAPTDPSRSSLFRLAARLATRKLPILPLGEPVLEALIRPGPVGLHLTAIGTITANWARTRPHR